MLEYEYDPRLNLNCNGDGEYSYSIATKRLLLQVVVRVSKVLFDYKISAELWFKSCDAMQGIHGHSSWFLLSKSKENKWEERAKFTFWYLCVIDKQTFWWLDRNF